MDLMTGKQEYAGAGIFLLMDVQLIILAHLAAISLPVSLNHVKEVSEPAGVIRAGRRLRHGIDKEPDRHHWQAGIPRPTVPVRELN